MGEFLDQMVGGGPPLRVLDGEEKDFADYCGTTAGGNAVRFLIDAHLEHGLAIRLAAGELEGFSGSSSYGFSAMSQVGDGEGPLPESQVRVILTWLGHGPSLAGVAWRTAFSSAVRARSEWERKNLLQKDFLLNSAAIKMTELIQE